MMPNVEVSFNGLDDDGTLFTVIHNPEVLPLVLRHQITRYGLIGPSTGHPEVSGILKGSRRAFTGDDPHLWCHGASRPLQHLELAQVDTRRSRARIP